MFEPSLPVHHHTQVVFEGVVFRGHIELQLTGNLSHPLVLLTPGLQILFQGDDAVTRQPPNILFCHFIAAQFVVARAIAVVEGISGGESAWANHLAGVSQFNDRKNVVSPGRGVKRRSNSVSQVACILVRVKGSHAGIFAVMVRVHVDQSRNNRLSFDVDDTIHSRGAAFAYVVNPAATNDDGSLRDDFLIFESDDSAPVSAMDPLGYCVRRSDATRSCLF